MNDTTFVARRPGFRYWVFPLVFAALLTGTGPCYDDECSNPGEGWCEGTEAVSCEGAGQNMAYYLRNRDCAVENLTCVEGLGVGYYGSGTPLSWCLNVQSCDKAGTYQCGVSPSDGTHQLMKCSNVSQTAWYMENSVEEIVSPAGVQLILEPPSIPDFNYPVEPVPCVKCSSTCGCQAGSVCRDGLCVPEQIAGQTDDGIVCCGRERGTSCLKGTSCENLDGTAGTCKKGARCDLCEASVDCESDFLECADVGGDLPSVCLSPAEAKQTLYDCREDLGEAWRVDACGRWVELAQDVAISHSCKDGTDQSWSLNACDQWIAMAKDCGPGFRCEANECILRVPEIEVSPTLLNFGQVAVSASQILPLDIGNLGDAPLTVTEILVQPVSTTSVMASATSFEVAPGQIVSLEVSFAPQEAGPVQAKVLIHSSDSDEPEVAVLVNGTGI